MMFLFPRWDMFVPWRALFSAIPRHVVFFFALTSFTLVMVSMVRSQDLQRQLSQMSQKQQTLSDILEGVEVAPLFEG